MASPAVDDYLKAIFAHTEWQDAPITPSVLAGALGVAPSSVTEMVKKLKAAGLVSHQPYGAIRLTPAGLIRALGMVRRHRLIETWLVRAHGYAWHEVHDEAEVLEHAISDRLLDSIDAQLGRPRYDPHGDAIPDADGMIQQAPFVLLRDAPEGHAGTVLRVNDKDPDLLCVLEDLGVTVGTALQISAGEVHLGATAVPLPADALDAIWLSA